MRDFWSRTAAVCLLSIGMFQAAHADDVTSAAELAFNNHCRECHMIDRGDNRVGPSLCGIIGRKAGSEAGFGNYSAALKDSGVVWDAASIDQWIKNPNGFLPGNNMNPFPGVDDAAQRRLIIAYLSSATCVKPIN